MNETLPYQQHSETSFIAAKTFEPKAPTARGRVLEYIKHSGDQGATDEEIQVALQMNPSTQRPRRIELVESEAVRDSGIRRETSGGRMAVVWVAVAG